MNFLANKRTQAQTALVVLFLLFVWLLNQPITQKINKSHFAFDVGQKYLQSSHLTSRLSSEVFKGVRENGFKYSNLQIPNDSKMAKFVDFKYDAIIHVLDDNFSEQYLYSTKYRVCFFEHQKWRDCKILCSKKQMSIDRSCEINESLYVRKGRDSNLKLAFVNMQSQKNAAVVHGQNSWEIDDFDSNDLSKMYQNVSFGNSPLSQNRNSYWKWGDNIIHLAATGRDYNFTMVYDDNERRKNKDGVATIKEHSKLFEGTRNGNTVSGILYIYTKCGIGRVRINADIIKEDIIESLTMVVSEQTMKSICPRFIDFGMRVKYSFLRRSE